METNIIFGNKGDGKESGGKSQEREREEEKVVHKRIALMNFFKRKVFFEKIMGLYQGLCEENF